MLDGRELKKADFEYSLGFLTHAERTADPLLGFDFSFEDELIIIIKIWTVEAQEQTFTTLINTSITIGSEHGHQKDVFK